MNRLFRRVFSRLALFGVICVVLGIFPLGAAEVMPPPPTKYFNDFANVTKPGTAAGLNQVLEQFEKDTSSQMVVAVFPKMQSDSSLEDYVHRMFQAWKIGQKDKNNGVLLAVFVQDRKMKIEVGYGLEGAIPDAIAKRIISDEMAPHFRAGNYDAGLSAAVNALMQAARGEYKGSGRTVGQGRGASKVPWPFIIFAIIFFLFAASSFGRRRRGTMFGGRRSSGWGPVIWTGGGGGWGSGGGGGWSGGGGGFSGGGGSSGGGGASGSW